MRLCYFFASLLLLLTSCGSIPRATVFQPEAAPPPPDYSQLTYWAAHPNTNDQADRTPTGLKDQQATALADVFFVHPTIYTKTRSGNEGWNASLQDEKLNEQVDESTILNQASIFNAAGRVFAPRYRQAHINVFQHRGSEIAESALDLAYQDVLAAFDHFLAQENQGRPIIIAAHSQGTVHAARLLQDRFVNTPLHKQLVIAYLIGMPVPPNTFESIPVCEQPTETGCFVSWRTYREDYTPVKRDRATVATVVNPLHWKVTPERVPAEENKGAVLYNYEKILPALVWAEIQGPRLHTNKPKFFGDIFFTRKNYHIGDLNLFWVNVRENAVDRVQAYLDRSR